MSPILNLKKKLGFKELPMESVKLHQMIVGGVKKNVVTGIKECLDLSVDELSELLPISKRQLQRYSENSRLSLEDTEHVVALSGVVIDGYELFEEPKEFRGWLMEPNLALGGELPFKIMKTIYGCMLVKTIIGRALHGVYS